MSGVSIQNVEKSFGEVRVIHGIDVEIEDDAPLSCWLARPDAGNRRFCG